MEKRILRLIVVLCCINISIASETIRACAWIENSETVRLAFFRAEISGMSAFRPFYYSAAYFNSYIPDPEFIDRVKNCREWKRKLGNDIDVNDIDIVLYQTVPAIFENARREGKLADLFPENTFIKKLLLQKNTAFLEYLSFAKEMEYINTESLSRWEQWDNFRYGTDFTDHLNKSLLENPYTQYFNKISEVKDEFLRERYAFMFLRMYSQSGSNNDVIRLYEEVFGDKKPESIIERWAILFYAIANKNLNNNPRGNYLLSLAFDASDEKKLVSLQRFETSPEMINSTLATTNDLYEKAVILAMQEFQNPGPSLKMLIKIDSLSPDNKYLAPLIMREINKLEDWLFTPRLTFNSPSVNLEKFQDWDYKKILDKNYKTDLTYLENLIHFIQKVYNRSTDETKDFLAVSLAHLNFMDDKIDQGKSYLASILPSANSSVLLQQSIDESLITLKTEDVTDDAVKNKLTDCILNLENIAKNYYPTYKTIYSLLRLIESEYEKKGDFALGGLLYMKSEMDKNKFDNGNNGYSDYVSPDNYYWGIAYFDKTATIQDLDKLMDIMGKKRKSPFEKYLCDQTLAKMDAYKDLKGTIAFRNNDLELAYKTFSEIPETFWSNNYEFRYYLHKNPYYPKCWEGNDMKIPSYSFNKTRFIKEVIDLKKELGKTSKNQAEICLKLGHAYYNCSFWGNCWMMVNYGKSGYEKWGRENYPDYIFFGNMYESKNKKQFENYYRCTIAMQYYRKALEMATDKELKATATLMLHKCTFNQYFAGIENTYEGDNISYTADLYLKDFYSTFRNTKAFEQLHCPLLDDFIGYKE
jgi:hypothetical protein